MDIEKRSKRVSNNYVRDQQNIETEWAKFCVMPDLVGPVRMPAFMPIHSHIVKRRLTKTITVGPTKTKHLVWAPEQFTGNGFLYGNDSASDANINPTESFGTSPNAGDWNASGHFWDSTDNLTNQVAHGGCRLIGAVMNIQYLGKFDDISGLVEIGLHLNSHLDGGTTTATNEHFEDVHFATDDEMQQAPYYTSQRLNNGARMIWFPIDSSKFEFKRASVTLGNNTTATDTDGNAQINTGSTTYSQVDQVIPGEELRNWGPVGTPIYGWYAPLEPGQDVPQFFHEWRYDIRGFNINLFTPLLESSVSSSGFGSVSTPTDFNFFRTLFERSSQIGMVD
jgi:hypothetical protein